jgi:hypothetical protein
MKKLKSIALTVLIAVGAFMSAYAFTPELDEVNCETPSSMFGTTECTDPVNGFKKYCQHTFWVRHSCSTGYGDSVPVETID